jgi:hypothetical protein
MTAAPPTALSVGLSDGLRYATENPADRRHLGQIARARNAGEIAALIAKTSIEPNDVVDEVAYWSGFAHGVRQFLHESARMPESRAD